MFALRFAGVEWAGAGPEMSLGGVAEGESGIVACVLSALAKSDREGPGSNRALRNAFIVDDKSYHPLRVSGCGFPLS